MSGSSSQERYLLTKMVETGEINPSLQNVKFEPLELYNALYMAVRSGHLDVVKHLIEVRQAPVYNDVGISPIQEAARQNRPDIIGILVENGVSLSEPNIFGLTPLQAAINAKAKKAEEYITTCLATPDLAESESVQHARKLAHEEKLLLQGNAAAGFTAAIYLLKHRHDISHIKTKDQIKNKALYLVKTAIDLFLQQNNYEELVNNALKLNEISSVPQRYVEPLEECVLYLIQHIPASAKLSPLNHLLIAEEICKRQDQLGSDKESLLRARHHVYQAESAVDVPTLHPADKARLHDKLQLRKEVKSKAAAIREEIAESLNKDDAPSTKTKTTSKIKFNPHLSIRLFDESQPEQIHTQNPLFNMGKKSIRKP